MKYKILDLFCGAGGFSSGFDSLDEFETVVGLDFDKDAILTFKNNFPNATGIVGDISESDVQSKIITLAKTKGVNMVIGGPPCQGFSLKGKKLGLNDPRNFLFLKYLNIVEQLKPEIFVIENVKNLTVCEKGYFINEIKKLFGDIGYIVNAGVLNAKHYGVPQSRERTIIIGSLTKTVSLPIADKRNIVTVKDAISDLSYLNSGEGSESVPYKNLAKSGYQQKLRNDDGILYNHKATNHAPIALEKLKLIPPEGDKTSLPEEYLGKQKFSTTWSRLKWDSVSPTVDTRFDTPSNGQNSHPYLNRAITPREAARLQSFHDSFRFYGKKTSICKQIGNAVPPLLARAIGESILNAVDSTEMNETDFSLYKNDAYNKIHELIKNGVVVDHIITDPPYNISKENNFDTLSNSKRVGIDFGEWDKDFDLFSWIDLYAKILDKNGSFIIFCSYRYISSLIDRLESNGLVVKDVLIWQKSNPMPRNINRRYVQDMEFAIWAVNKNAKWVFNKEEDKPYSRSLVQFPLVSGAERTSHPTQKSVKMLKHFIKIHTDENQLVLDPFMGSGSVGVACLELERKFMGIEIAGEYFEIASDRIKNAESLSNLKQYTD